MSAAAWMALLLALTPAEERGREIYLHGTGAPAVVGDAPVGAPMPCAGCHGAEGRGGGEGGVRAPAITWDALSHPGAARPAYEPRSLVRAIAMGIGASGRPLPASMPRYQLRREEADDLVAFLRRLGTLRDPGLSDDALVLGVLLPGTSPGAGASAREEVRGAALAWAAEVNARGGIYTRRVELRFVDRPSDGDPPFLYLGWGGDGVARWMAEHEVPFLRAGGGTDQASPFVFDLGPSPSDEARALQRQRGVFCPDVASIRSAPAGVRALVPSALADEAIAVNPAGGAIIAARVAPSDIDPALAAAYHLAPAHLSDQWSLLAAARLAENVLQRAGAGVSRASFVATLQQTRRFATGFSPPLTFDAERSRGTDVVRLLRLDPKTRSLTPAE